MRLWSILWNNPDYLQEKNFSKSKMDLALNLASSLLDRFAGDNEEEEEVAPLGDDPPLEEELEAAISSADKKKDEPRAVSKWGLSRECQAYEGTKKPTKTWSSSSLPWSLFHQHQWWNQTSSLAEASIGSLIGSLEAEGQLKGWGIGMHSCSPW